jgi:serine/threonine-protein kinase
MQLVEGVSLRSVLDWAPLPGREAVRLAVEILDALEYVSDQGIVRLDLKPSNVILDLDRKPIIVDLGLAKVVDGPGEERQDVTMVGALVGTPTYFSPEQATGGPVDVRTDIYTVGLLVYEMLTGRPARRGDEVGLVIEQARHAEVDVSGLPISPELRDVVARALARDPDERFAAAAEMRAALLATPEGDEAPTARAPVVDD